MKIVNAPPCLLLAAFLLAPVPPSPAQQAYIGFVYPAGARQGTAARVIVGGQALDGVAGARISGRGARAKVLEYRRLLGNQEISLLNEQLRELRQTPESERSLEESAMIPRIEKIVSEYVQNPACASIANIVELEVELDPDAEPGEREIRLLTPRGVSNPLVFWVGELPEVTAPPMPTSAKQILGREEQSLRRKKSSPALAKPASDGMMAEGMMSEGMAPGGGTGQSSMDDGEIAIALPCILNGQIASGAVDRFRFKAARGQRLVVATMARSLVPYMADAVPGWFQPVAELYNRRGDEVAYNDDYFSRPDPVILCEIPEDGEYTLAIRDSIYRGREDFVYRVTVGEVPFVSSVFPIGGPSGKLSRVALSGCNLDRAGVTLDAEGASPGIYPVAVRGRGGLMSNPFLFAVDDLPECEEQTQHAAQSSAQKLALPVIVNGRISSPGERDWFSFDAPTGGEVVAEVCARRLGSPMDAAIMIADQSGKCLAFNDDCDDPGSGLNTHHADSYLICRLPSNGVYYVLLEDIQRGGGPEYAYRLRVSAPRPDFALRVVPSSVAIRSEAAGGVGVHAIRRDGFTNAISLRLKNPPPGFDLKNAVIAATQQFARVNIKTSLRATEAPVPLVIEGFASCGSRKIVREAVPVEDRMQAFLWRHLVPARELLAMVFEPPPAPPKPSVATATNAPPPRAAPAVTNSPRP